VESRLHKRNLADKSSNLGNILCILGNILSILGYFLGQKGAKSIPYNLIEVFIKALVVVEKMSKKHR
jgi:hypothetical protein